MVDDQPLAFRERIRDNVMRLCSSGSALLVGTLCSGLDGAAKILLDLCSIFSQLAGGNNLFFQYEFAVEIDKAKREFVNSVVHSRSPQLQPRLQFADVRCMDGPTALDVFTGSHELIPAVHLAVIGFECKSVSSLNPDRDPLCVLEETGPTGETFAGTIRYLRAHRPQLAVLENVRMLGSLRRKRGRDEEEDPSAESVNPDNLAVCVGPLVCALGKHLCLQCGPQCGCLALWGPQWGDRTHDLLD